MKKIIFLLFVSFIFGVACNELTLPDLKDYHPACRAGIVCMFLNQKNPDKTICADAMSGCKNANDFIVCRESKDEFASIKDCLLLLRK